MVQEKDILNCLNDFKFKQMQNSIAIAQGWATVPYPEITQEYLAEQIEKERATYMYGYGISFQDDREREAYERGELIF